MSTAISLPSESDIDLRPTSESNRTTCTTQTKERCSWGIFLCMTCFQGLIIVTPCILQRILTRGACEIQDNVIDYIDINDEYSTTYSPYSNITAISTTNIPYSSTLDILVFTSSSMNESSSSPFIRTGWTNVFVCSYLFMTPAVLGWIGWGQYLPAVLLSAYQYSFIIMCIQQWYGVNCGEGEPMKVIVMIGFISLFVEYSVFYLCLLVYKLLCDNSGLSDWYLCRCGDIESNVCKRSL